MDLLHPTDERPPDVQPNERRSSTGPTLAYARFLSREDVSNQGDARVDEVIEDLREWADRQRHRARARREGRDWLTLADFEADGMADR